MIDDVTGSRRNCLQAAVAQQECFDRVIAVGIAGDIDFVFVCDLTAPTDGRVSQRGMQPLVWQAPKVLRPLSQEKGTRLGWQMVGVSLQSPWVPSVGNFALPYFIFTLAQATTCSTALLSWPVRTTCQGVMLPIRAEGSAAQL